jgi:hypothetical protein
MLNLMSKRHAVLLGILLGIGFGIWNLIATRLDPLADDSSIALLEFYVPMFAIWSFAGFAASRQSGRLVDGIKIGALVALVTFVVFDLAVIVRVNLFLVALSQREDWQTLMERFRASGIESLRTFVNYAYLTGAPFKILVASAIGVIMGLIGGLIGSFGRHVRDESKA